MANLALILHPTRELIDGSKVVVLRITHDRQRKYLPMGMSCKPEFWDSKRSQLKKSYNPENYKELNNELKIKFSKAEKIVMKFESDLIPFRFETFQEKFLIKKEKWTVLSFFDKRINELKDLGRYGNASVYQSAKSAVERFKPGKDVYFQDISTQFLVKFEAFLRNTGCGNNTIYNYVKTLRALYNSAISEDLVNKDLYPFFNNFVRSGYKVQKLRTVTTKRAITAEDLKKIHTYQPEELSIQQDAKLFFLFSYYAWGINFVDMAYLRWDKNIHSDAIVYSRIKTRHKKKFRVPIKHMLLEILNHYRKFDNAGYIFPVFNEFHDTDARRQIRVKTALKKINKTLSNIGEELEISTPLTSYVARHTFASTMKSRNAPASAIKEMMGHENEETTEIYLKEFSNDVLSQYSDLLDIE